LKLSLCLYTIFVLLSFGGVALAQVKEAELTPVSRRGSLQIQTPSLLIVTHPSRKWDRDEIARPGIENAMSFARKNKIPILFLQSPPKVPVPEAVKGKIEPEAFQDPIENYYTLPKDVSYRVYSHGGAIDLWRNRFAEAQNGNSLRAEHIQMLKVGVARFAAKEILSVGGHFDQCQLTTFHSIMGLWGQNEASENLKYTVVLDASYAHLFYTRKDNDLDRKLSDWVSDQTGRRWGGSNDGMFSREPRLDRKVKMTEYGQILGEKDLQKFLTEFAEQRMLSSEYQLPENHNIVMARNGKPVRTLRHTHAGAPTLTIDFVDSL
jgi:hypothetical protein